MAVVTIRVRQTEGRSAAERKSRRKLLIRFKTTAKQSSERVEEKIIIAFTKYFI